MRARMFVGHLVEHLRRVAAGFALDEREHGDLVHVADCIRFAVTSSASSSGIPSCSSVTTRRNSRFDGSGASSATTPIAPARL